MIGSASKIQEVTIRHRAAVQEPTVAESRVTAGYGAGRAIAPEGMWDDV